MLAINLMDDFINPHYGAALGNGGEESEERERRAMNRPLYESHCD